MSQATTVRLHHAPTITLRAPRLGAAVRRASAIAVWVVLAIVIAVSAIAAIEGADQHETGIPTRIAPPSVVEQRASDAASSAIAQPQPAPAPGPAR